MHIALLGCGSIGRRHLGNLVSLGHAGLVVYDPDPAIRAEVAQSFGVTVHAALDDVWRSRPDVALITSPSQFHAQQALEAIQQGCAVFVEKPLSHTMDGLDDVIAAAQARNVVTMVACNMRFHPGPSQVKQWLDQGAVGSVIAARVRTGSYLPRWRPHQDYRTSYSASPVWGGAVLDCIHELDLALWLLGDAVLAAAAVRPATALGLSTDGLAEIILAHHSGGVSSVHLNFVQRNYKRTIEVIGATGAIEWDYSAGHTILYGPEGAVAKTALQPPGWTVNDMYRDELMHFLDRVERRQATDNPLARAARTLEIALAARAA